jgi:hypothetical protein
MVRIASVIAAILLAGCNSGKLARGDRNASRLERAGNEPGLSFTVCGAVTSYVPATKEAAGSLAIERRAWEVARGTEILGDDLLVMGSDVCIDGEFDTERRIVVCVVSTPTAPGWPSE